jgi:predicted dithiol-disulfide oxidoreductase (DUF899 family)
MHVKIRKEQNMYDILHHPVVSHEEWLAARKQLLAEEKEFTRLRDRLSPLLTS